MNAKVLGIADVQTLEPIIFRHSTCWSSDIRVPVARILIGALLIAEIGVDQAIPFDVSLSYWKLSRSVHA